MAISQKLLANLAERRKKALAGGEPKSSPPAGKKG